MILIASNNPKLTIRWTRALHGKYPTCVITEKSAIKESLQGLKPSVLLVDVGLPRLRTARELPKFQRLSPTTKIMAMSSSANSKEALAVLKAGAKGYCPHGINGTILRKAVKAVLSGEFWAGRKVLSELIDEAISARTQKVPHTARLINADSLSPRQRQIAVMILDAARNKEIAEKLKISEAAVKAHISAMFRKFNLSTRLELARLLAATASRGATSSR
jgi:two-component system, NarL family, nitrate/nitrite response regulator NarL